MRLLDRRAGLLSMQQLGMDKAVMEAFQALLSRPNGIILVTGPTGSGKTTTLYAALRRVHSEDKNIITVEDPVEYELKGVGQMQVNPRVGLTFASGLRAILRQDPDVVMVGEIRDLETAQIATQASLTGHLVLSTLHTNDAAGAITRLLDIGVEPYLVASSLLGVLAQRLLRLLCPECKEPYPAQEAEAQYVKARQLYRPRGCPRCGHTGYLGRTGVFELLLISPAVRELIVAKADAKAIHAQALQEGLVPLREHALTKVSQGLTSLQEALRVVQKEHAQV
jgi:general secretion pathway protein E